jgi:hypothetical protein
LLCFKLERRAIVDVIPDVLLTPQDVVNGVVAPTVTQRVEDSLCIQFSCNFGQALEVHGIGREYPPDDLDLSDRPQRERHPVGLKVLLLSAFQPKLRKAAFID